MPKAYRKDYRNRPWNYEKFNGSAEQIKKRSSRNSARRMLWLKVWDTRDVDHKNGNPNDNSKSNLRAISREKNRWLGAKKKAKMK